MVHVSRPGLVDIVRVMGRVRPMVSVRAILGSFTFSWGAVYGSENVICVWEF